MSELQLLSAWCEEIGVSVGSKQKWQILLYLSELVDWNRRLNLVAKASDEQILRKHFVDSLSLVPFVPARQHSKLLDVGAGAGFPGLVLKIACPSIFVSLLESSEKKCVFLRHVISLLELDGVDVLTGRAECWGRMDSQRERYDVVVCRAVAHLSVVSEYAFPFLKTGGFFMAQKGPAGPREFEEAKDAIGFLGGKLKEKREFVLPGGGERRIILIFRKEGVTPPEYPRRDGVPAKKPLQNVPRGTIPGRGAEEKPCVYRGKEVK